jgi:dihydrolipoamide dehydrogenase
MTFDLAVIGAGWAGMNAALAAARQGRSVVLIEERDLGGTCLNRGCIPTKVFITQAQHGLSFSDIQKKKIEVVDRLRQGLAFLVKSNKIEYIQGRARFEGPSRLVVDDRVIEASSYLVATGSRPKSLPSSSIDSAKLLTSDDMLQLDRLPSKVLVVGGGVIGCEFACFLKRMGVATTVVEALPQLLPGFDVDVAKKLKQFMEKSGIAVHVGKTTNDVDVSSFDKILAAIGREAVTDGVGLEAAGVIMEKGVISVDRELQTNAKGIYAAGDCIGGYMLAHVASYEGELAAANATGDADKAGRGKRDYVAVPASVFTDPEIGTVGVREEEARSFGVRAKTRRSITFLSAWRMSWAIRVVSQRSSSRRKRAGFSART